MKKIYLIIILAFVYYKSFSQNIEQILTVTIDTINVHGKLIDEQGKPIFNALVLSETFNENHSYIQAKTDKNGLFKLNGIKPVDRLHFHYETDAVVYSLNGSRYLLAIMKQMQKLALNTIKPAVSITAKRISPKEKYSYKVKATLSSIGFDPFGLYSPANYPHGLQKFYDFIKEHIIYPEKAIKNNIEGIVAIEFTIDVKGNYKDFLVIRDIGFGCADEVIRVVKNSKKWYPAMNGNFVAQKISLEVPFKLLD